MNLSKSLATALLLLGTANATAFDPKKDVHDYDRNVWAYDAQFQQRFRMDEAGITPELKGARAVAFRVESQRLWFPFLPDRDGTPICSLEIYLDSDVKLPWRDDKKADKNYVNVLEPPFFLKPQRPEDLAAAHRREHLGFSYPDPGELANGVVVAGVGSTTLGPRPVREFLRDVYPGITYIAFQEKCDAPLPENYWLDFGEFDLKQAQAGKLKYKRVLRIDMPHGYTARIKAQWDGVIAKVRGTP